MLNLLLAAMLLIGLSACGKKTWQEEVKQADGSILIVTRTIQRGGGSEIGQSTPVAAETLSFTDPKTGQLVSWSAPSGRHKVDPVLLQSDGQVAWVLVKPRSCGDWREFGKPDPAFVLYKVEQGKTTQHPARELPEAYRYMNILFWPKDEYNQEQIKLAKYVLKQDEIDRLNQRRIEQGTKAALIHIDFEKYDMYGCGE